MDSMGLAGGGGELKLPPRPVTPQLPPPSNCALSLLQTPAEAGAGANQTRALHNCQCCPTPAAQHHAPAGAQLVFVSRQAWQAWTQRWMGHANPMQEQRRAAGGDLPAPLLPPPPTMHSHLLLHLNQKCEV
eukprot:575708-Pelagomonas_calceolata.AAC.1